MNPKSPKRSTDAPRGTTDSGNDIQNDQDEAAPEETILNKEETALLGDDTVAPPPPRLSPDEEPPREMADFLKPPVVKKDVVDEASQESFPASDPPGYTSASASPEKDPTQVDE